MRKTLVKRHGNRYVRVGAFNLYPTLDIAELTYRMKDIIQSVEEAAYKRGAEDARLAIKKALGD